jgi:hypothetical protein
MIFHNMGKQLSVVFKKWLAFLNTLVKFKTASIYLNYQSIGFLLSFISLIKIFVI